MLLTLLLACAAPESANLLDYDASRTGAEGADGPWGVHRDSTFDADPPNDLFTPVDSEGAAADVGEAAVTIVLIQGGSVVPERYGWLAEHFASRGATVIVPHHGFDLAFFDQTAGNRALAAAVAAGTVDEAVPVGILGHSLGGVVSAYQWADDDTIAGLALLASYPADDADVESRTAGAVLSIRGSTDAKVSAEQQQEGADRFTIDHAVVTVDGMNHYDWTDDATEGELASDGAAAEDQGAARQVAQWALDGWVDDCLTGASASWAGFAAANAEGAVGAPCAGAGGVE